MSWRKRLAVAAVILAAAGGIGWYILRGRQADSDRLVLYGNVDIRQVNLAFNVEGRIAEMLVHEGDRVTPGQKLASVERDYYEDGQRLAEARLEAQRAQVAKLEAGSRPEEIQLARAQVAEAEAALVNARASFQRIIELNRREVVSQQALDDARATVDRSAAQLDGARQQLALAIAGPRKEDIAAARAQLRADEAALDLVRRRLADTVLAAPGDGTVLTRVLEPGAIILPGSTVYTLSITDPVWLRTYVPEPMLGRIKPGMTVAIATDSAPGKTLHGRIGFIAPIAEFTPRAVETPDLRAGLVYRVRVIADDPDDVLRQGMPVTITADPPPAAGAGT